jgi:hypothetical protein
MYRYDESLDRCVEINDPRGASFSSFGPEIMVKGNISYASPIDGKPITTWAARDYDLKSSGCVPYDEGREMVQDAKRNRRGLTEGLGFGDIKQFLRDA